MLEQALVTLLTQFIFLKIKDHYAFLVFNNKQETTITKFNDNQVVEDEISQNCNTTDTEW